MVRNAFLYLRRSGVLIFFTGLSCCFIPCNSPSAAYIETKRLIFDAPQGFYLRLPHVSHFFISQNFRQFLNEISQ